MASRIHRIGTIFSRIDGLIRKGHLKPEDRPLWYDVYKAFPPKYEPTLKRVTPDVKVQQILYKEDALRALIHDALPDQLGLIRLSGDRGLLSEQYLETCQRYISEGLSTEEAVEKLKLAVEESKFSKDSKSEETNMKELLDKVL